MIYKVVDITIILLIKTIDIFNYLISGSMNLLKTKQQKLIDLEETIDNRKAEINSLNLSIRETKLNYDIQQINQTAEIERLKKENEMLLNILSNKR